MVARRTRRGADRRALLAVASIAGLLLFGIGSADAATVTVAAVNFEFQPASRSVTVGDIVRWTFAGDPHTVTSGAPGAPDGRFDSGIKDPGGSFQVTFDAAGTYRYFCQIHPEQMIGTIVVSAGSAPTPRPTARPTAKPTARPTAKPTTRPTAAPTVAPTTTPSASPSPSATATAPLETPSTSPTPSPTAIPAVSGSIGPESSSPSPGATLGDGQAASGVDPIPIVAAIVVLGLLVAGGLAWARRPRGSG